jgi:6-phosphogluconolactonase
VGSSTGEPEVVVLPDPAAVSAAAAERFAAAVVDAARRRGRADVATTGGSTPVGIYTRLGAPPLRDAVPWELVHIWFGDDRFVERDHPLSNVLPVDQILARAAARGGLSGDGASGVDVLAGVEPGVPLPAENIHPFPCGDAIAESRSAGWCAQAYAEQIRADVEHDDEGWPVFDLVLLGVGPDGHILSVFPGSSALSSTDLALAIPAPAHVEPHVERVTLNPRFLDAAREVLVISHGAGKAEVIGTIFGSERDPGRWPAQLVRRAGVTWLLDEAAAARLPERAGRRT